MCFLRALQSVAIAVCGVPSASCPLRGAQLKNAELTELKAEEEKLKTEMDEACAPYIW